MSMIIMPLTYQYKRGIAFGLASSFSFSFSLFIFLNLSMSLKILPFLGGKEIPPRHFPSRSCQHVISCIKDEDLKEAIFDTIGTKLNEGSLVKILSFNE